MPSLDEIIVDPTSQVTLGNNVGDGIVVGDGEGMEVSVGNGRGVEVDTGEGVGNSVGVEVCTIAIGLGSDLEAKISTCDRMTPAIIPRMLIKPINPHTQRGTARQNDFALGLLGAATTGSVDSRRKSSRVASGSASTETEGT
jgi:hypothetical protein